MKKLSSAFFMWFGFGLAIAAVLAMFLPCIEVTNVEMACARFWDVTGSMQNKGAWPSFIGYMLILVGGLTMGVIAFPSLEIEAKTEKIVLISAGAAILVGTILALLEGPFLMAMNPKDSKFKDIIYHTGMYITGVFGVAAVVMDAIALKLDW